VNTPVPVNIITGMLGAGKTTTIQYLLSQLPPEERWAVLVNEFGNIGIDGALIEGQGVAVREVPGGCICCTAALTLRTTLTDMLRRIPMDRLLIEPTGIGHPAGIVDTLRDEWLRDAIRLENIITIVDPAGFGSDRLEKSPIYRDQLQIADVVLINKTDTVDEARLQEIEAWLNDLYPPKQQVLRTQDGQMPLDWLKGQSQSPIESGSVHEHLHGEACSLERPGPAGSLFSSREEAGIHTLGWRFPPELVFDRQRIERRVKDWMQLPHILRIKAVLNCGRSSYAVNATPQTCDISPVAWRQDSRVELLVASDGEMDEAQIEQELEGLIQHPG
jgi:G3E family GTPase